MLRLRGVKGQLLLLTCVKVVQACCLQVGYSWAAFLFSEVFLNPLRVNTAERVCYVESTSIPNSNCEESLKKLDNPKNTSPQNETGDKTGLTLAHVRRTEVGDGDAYRAQT